MNIYIPTMGRVQTQKTWNSIPKSLRKNTFLVCHHDEAEQHLALGRNIVSCPKQGKISEVRQWLLDPEGYGGKKLVMVDDDFYFFRRIDIKRENLRKCQESDMIEMFSRIESLLDQYPMVGVAPRQISGVLGLRKDAVKVYEIEPGLSLNRRITGMYGIRADILNKENIRFDDIPLMEDMHVNLSLISKGYDIALITEFAWNQENSGTKGGCSSYRNFDLQKESSIKLAQLHRPFVMVITKTMKDKEEKNWKSVGRARYDVRVNWTKAVLVARQARSTLF